MFTGIVTDIGTVAARIERNDVRRLAVECRVPFEGLPIGGSIACNGICLTVVARERMPDGGTRFEVDAAPETLAVTTAGRWDVGTRLNLEPPLKIGDELSGHVVSGHVDGIATIVRRDDLGESTRFWFEAPRPLARFVAPKGSVCLDGTSLTVNAVDGTRFDCLLIPHTLSATTWGERRAGDAVNLEVDMLARYVARLNETAAWAAEGA
ncbi:MAG: riboflavin synthase [Rhizobiales bacterium]|nr:riboflavin synthase [Hyphomicrobiales bacterium]